MIVTNNLQAEATTRGSESGMGGARLLLAWTTRPELILEHPK
jgi:hypothetical protein